MPIRPFQRRVAALGAIAVAASLAACVAPPVAITPAAKASIHTVRVNPIVKMPSQMLYVGPKEGVAMLVAGPLLGQQAAASVGAGVKAQLAAEMQANQIDVGAIVAAEFARQASAGTSMAFVVGSAPADAQVDLVVNVFGIAHAHAVGAMLYPVVNLSATMKTADGAVIWQATHVASAQDIENKDGHALEEFMQDPELLRHAFVEGSDIVSRVMVQDLTAVPKPRPGHLDSTAAGVSNAYAHR
jgi:hypothetical protein